MFTVSFTPTLHQAAYWRSRLGVRLQAQASTCFRASTESADHATTGTHQQQNSITLRIPPLSSSLTRKCHPMYNRLREEVDAWLLSIFDPPLQGARRDFLIDSQFPFAACMHYFHCDDSLITTISKLHAYYFIVDDTLEALQSKASTRHLADSLLKGHLACLLRRPLVRHRQQQELDPRLCRLLESFRVPWEEMCTFVPQHLMSKCVEALLDYIKANAEEHKLQQAASNNTADEAMTVQKMLAHRVNCVGAMTGFSYLEIAMASTGWGANPVVHRVIHTSRRCKELFLIAAQHGIEVNDLMSFKKEYTMGNKMNLMSVLSGELTAPQGRLPMQRGDRLQAAVEELWRMIQRTERRFLEALDGLRAAGLEEFGGDARVKMEIVRFAEGLEWFMAGNMYWESLCARYHGSHPLSWDSQSLVVLPAAGDASVWPNLDVTS